MKREGHERIRSIMTKVDGLVPARNSDSKTQGEALTWHEDAVSIRAGKAAGGRRCVLCCGRVCWTSVRLERCRARPCTSHAFAFSDIDLHTATCRAQSAQHERDVRRRGCLIHEENSATAPTHSAIVPTSTITITHTAASPLRAPPARPLAALQASRQQPWPHAKSKSCSYRIFRSLELVLTHDSHSYDRRQVDAESAPVTVAEGMHTHGVSIACSNGTSLIPFDH